MKRVVLYLGLATVCAASALWYFDPDIRMSKTPPASISETNVTPVAEGADPAERSSPASSLPEDGKVELALDYAVGRKCNEHYFVNDDGISDSVIECVPVGPTPHPYTAYSDEVLTNLAYGDAKAAEVIGRRWIARSHGLEEEQTAKLKSLGVQYHLRAAALSGDVSLIKKAAGQAYSMTSDVNGLRTDNVVNSFVLGEVAARLGGPEVDGRWQTDPWHQMFDALEFTEGQMTEVESRITRAVQETADTQTSVTGNTHFAEVLDNA